MTTAQEAAAYQTGAGTSERADWMARSLAGHLPPSGVLLEYGALGLTDRLAAHVCCVEPDFELSRHGKGPTVHADPRMLPFAEGSVAAIVSTSARPFGGQAVFREAHRVLCPAGYIVVIVPAPSAPVRDPIGQILAPMRTQLRPASRLVIQSQMTADAELAGFLITRSPLPPHPYMQSPLREAEDIRNRASSLLWGVSESTWSQVVEPAISALMSLPDVGTPRLRHAYCDLITMYRQ